MKNLIDKIAADFGTTKKDAKAIIEAVFAGVVETTKDEGAFKVSGFGKFTLKEKAARKGRNPKTGETVDIPAKTVFAFKASKDVLN